MRYELSGKRGPDGYEIVDTENNRYVGQVVDLDEAVAECDRLNSKHHELKYVGRSYYDKSLFKRWVWFSKTTWTIEGAFEFLGWVRASQGPGRYYATHPWVCRENPFSFVIVQYGGMDV